MNVIDIFWYAFYTSSIINFYLKKNLLSFIKKITNTEWTDFVKDVSKILYVFGLGLLGFHAIYFIGIIDENVYKDKTNGMGIVFAIVVTFWGVVLYAYTHQKNKKSGDNKWSKSYNRKDYRRFRR